MEQHTTEHTTEHKELTDMFANCRATYAAYSDAADQNGYYEALEPGIVQTIETLEYIRSQADQIIAAMAPGQRTMGNNSYATLFSLSGSCTDYIKKMASLRDRKKSLFATTKATNIKNKVGDVFTLLFTQEWFRDYTNVANVDMLVEKGVTHGFFQRGKQEKLMKQYMLTINEMDIIIYGLISIYVMDDIVFGSSVDAAIQAGIEDVIICINEAKEDPRLLKTVYNKYGELFKYLLKKSGVYFGEA